MSNLEQDKITKEIIRIAVLLGLPGTLMAGLGLYGIFSFRGDEEFLSFLSNKYITYGLLIGGWIIVSIELMLILPLKKKLRQLQT